MCREKYAIKEDISKIRAVTSPSLVSTGHCNEMKLFLCISALGWQVPYFNLISSEKWLWNGWTFLKAPGEGISREYFPKGSLLLKNHRCCMMKKLKALPASSPWHILQSSDFLQPFCPFSHCKQIQEFCFLVQAKPNSPGRSCAATFSAGSWAMSVCPELWHPARHQRELGRRGVDPAVCVANITPGTAQGNVPWKRRTPHFPISATCPETSQRIAHLFRAGSTPAPSWLRVSVLESMCVPQGPAPEMLRASSAPCGVWGRHTAILGWLHPCSDAPCHCCHRSLCWTPTPEIPSPHPHFTLHRLLHLWELPDPPVSLGCGEDPLIRELWSTFRWKYHCFFKTLLILLIILMVNNSFSLKQII